MPECAYGRASALSSEWNKSLGGFVSDAEAYLHRATRKQRKIVQSFCEREGWHYFHSIRKAVDVSFHDLDRRARDHEIYKIVLFLEIEAGCRDPFVNKEYELAWKGKERSPSPSPTDRSAGKASQRAQRGGRGALKTSSRSDQETCR